MKDDNKKIFKKMIKDMCENWQTLFNFFGTCIIIIVYSKVITGVLQNVTDQGTILVITLFYIWSVIRIVVNNFKRYYMKEY